MVAMYVLCMYYDIILCMYSIIIHVCMLSMYHVITIVVVLYYGSYVCTLYVL